MAGLYIASTSRRAGKTLFVCSLGLLLQQKGYKVGYMKPVGAELKRVEAGNGDADALIVQEFLGQDEKPETLTPVMLPDALSSLLLSTPEGFAAEALQTLKSAYNKITEGKDITLVSGTGAFPYTGSFAGLNSLSIIDELKLKVLIVSRYEGNTVNYEALLFAKQMLGDKLIGAVLNDVPADEIPACQEFLVPYLQKRGVNVMGIMPRESRLHSIRCIDLAYDLNGRIVAGNQNANRSVEDFLIGTMQVENFMSRLRNMQDRTIIVGGDRADLQLAALNCKCPCLILTGNMGPSSLVRAKAEESGTPVIAVREDTYEVARHMSRILRGQKFHDLGQIYKGIDLVQKAFDMEALLSNEAIGLQKAQPAGE